MAKKYTPIGTILGPVDEDNGSPWGWIIMVIIGLGLLGQCAG